MVTRIKIGNTLTRIWSNEWIKTNHKHYKSPTERGQVWFNIRTKEIRTLDSYDAIGEHYKAIRLAKSRTIDTPNKSRSLLIPNDK